MVKQGDVTDEVPSLDFDFGFGDTFLGGFAMVLSGFLVTFSYCL